jgi:ectoine hydroxylase-related dioxygenase (phytanoyl-CoA dioxygenase family)
MQLGWLGKRRLLRDGYVIVRSVVPRPRVDAALRAINRSLGERGIPPERLNEMRARTFCPELISAAEIMDLYAATAARDLVASVVGSVRPVTEAQIALRFPQAAPAGPAVPHIDGIATPDNGVPAGTLHHFTALLGVFLSDVTGPEAGNLVVWPGSHHALEAHFRRHGPQSAAGGMPRVPLSPPRPIAARAGDVVLAHYALAHGVAPNLGGQVRYAVFYRLYHQDHEAAGTRPLENLWFEWEGMRRAGAGLRLRGQGEFDGQTSGRPGRDTKRRAGRTAAALAR